MKNIYLFASGEVTTGSGGGMEFLGFVIPLAMVSLIFVSWFFFRARAVHLVKTLDLRPQAAQFSFWRNWIVTTVVCGSVWLVSTFLIDLSAKSV